MQELHFYYDIVCPYAYLASLRVEAVARAAGAKLVWRPVLLGGAMRAVGAPVFPEAEMPASKVRLGRDDRRRWASHLGVELHRPPEHPRRTVSAMRLLVAAPEHVRPDLSRRLFEAYWVDGEDVANMNVLGRIAAEHGMDADIVRSEDSRRALFTSTAELVERGGFGVPTFGLGKKIWWGQDRLHFVAEALGLSREVAVTALDRPGADGGLVSGSALAIRGSSDAKLTFFHDFSSPFSYLAATQIERVARESGCTVEWVPILLGALFREIGTPDVPLFTFSAARRALLRKDLDHWAAWWGVGFRFPEVFPLRTVTPLRVALQAPEMTLPIYRAAWEEGRDVGDPHELVSVLDEAGGAGAELVVGASDSDVKKRLRANTERAVAAGVCGVPSFLVNGVLTWGQDRLPLLAAELAASGRSG